MYNSDYQDFQDPEEDPKPQAQQQPQDPAQPVQPPAYPEAPATGPVTTQPVAPPVAANAPATPAPTPAPALADWQSVQSGDMSRAWSDFIEKQYGTAARGGGFANMAAGGLNQAVNEFNTATGAKARLVAGPSGDMVDFGDGKGPVDVKTAEGLLWNARLGGNNGQPGGGAVSGAAGAAGAAGGGANNGFPDFSKLFSHSSSSSGPAYADKASELFNMLMARARQSTAVDPNDPTIRAQADAFSAAQTRSGRQYLQQLAESKGAGGNIGAEARMTAEKGAQASAANEGALMGHELDSRRQEIMQALAQAGQFMTAQQQLSLQEELAGLNAAVQKYGIDTNNGQYYAGLNSQNSQFDRNLSQRAYEYDTTDNYNRTRV
jgi:hypothetical protein